MWSYPTAGANEFRVGARFQFTVTEALHTYLDALNRRRLSAMTSPGTVEGDQESGAQDNSLGRLLTLSDGVFAIAATLLALDLHVPDLGSDPSDHALRHALAEQTPSWSSRNALGQGDVSFVV